MMRFSNKVAWISGAGGYIGGTTARMLAAEGAAVAVCDINEACVEKTVSAIVGAGGKAVGIVCDITNSASVDAAVESSKTAIIKQIGTLFIVCFAFLFRREDRFTLAKLAGGILGFASILVINLEGLRLRFTVWDLLVVCASFASVASTIFSKNAYDRCDPLYVTALSQLIGGAILLLIGMLLGGRMGKAGPVPFWILAYICLASCVGYGLWNLLLKYHDMSRMSTIKFAETLFSAVFSWTILGENIFRWQYLFSFALVAAGLIISTHSKP